MVRRRKSLGELLRLEVNAHVALARRQPVGEWLDDAPVHGIRQQAHEPRRALRLEDGVAVEEFVPAVAGERDLGRAGDLATDEVFRQETRVRLRLVEQRGNLACERCKYRR